MKIITPYLLGFASAAVLLTIAFRFTLSTGIENANYTLVSLSAVTYGSMMFIAGWLFGKKDSEYLPIFDIGFRFHLATYIIHNGISILWVTSKLSSPKESLSIVTSVAAYWGIFIVIHFVFYVFARKRTVEGLDKEDLFD